MVFNPVFSLDSPVEILNLLMTRPYPRPIQSEWPERGTGESHVQPELTPIALAQ